MSLKNKIPCLLKNPACNNIYKKKTKKTNADNLRNSLNPATSISVDKKLKHKRTNAPNPLDSPLTPSIKFQALHVTRTPNKQLLRLIKIFEKIKFKIQYQYL